MIKIYKIANTLNINKIRNDINNFYNKKKEIKDKQRSYYRNKKWDKYYGTKQWHDLRTQYYNDHPLCEACLKEGYIKQCEHVHHRVPFSTGTNEEDKYRLLLDYNNLIALCKRHHNIAHEYMNKYNTDSADIDDIIYYEKKYYTDFM